MFNARMRCDSESKKKKHQFTVYKFHTRIHLLFFKVSAMHAAADFFFFLNVVQCVQSCLKISTLVESITTYVSCNFHSPSPHPRALPHANMVKIFRNMQSYLYLFTLEIGKNYLKLACRNCFHLHLNVFFLFLLNGMAHSSYVHCYCLSVVRMNCLNK